MSMEQLQYPIGKFSIPEQYTPELIHQWTHDIKLLPAMLEKEILHLSDAQLDTPYRDRGWTVRQLVHHLADSHLNAFVRFKLALTEPQTPTINAYRQDDWAGLPDSRLPVKPSLDILRGIHQRWASLLDSMQSHDWEKGFVHPEKGRMVSLKEATGTYAWHGRHHVAHITALKKRQAWK